MPPEDTPKSELAKTRAECERLRAENARLKVRLGDSPISVVKTAVPLSASKVNDAERSETVTNSSHPDLKVSLFRSLFRGRDDVYAVRWEGKGGRTGYSPAGIRECEPSAFTK